MGQRPIAATATYSMEHQPLFVGGVAKTVRIPLSLKLLATQVDIVKVSSIDIAAVLLLDAWTNEDVLPVSFDIAEQYNVSAAVVSPEGVRMYERVERFPAEFPRVKLMSRGARSRAIEAMPSTEEVRVLYRGVKTECNWAAM